MTWRGWIVALLCGLSLMIRGLPSSALAGETREAPSPHDEAVAEARRLIRDRNTTGSVSPHFEVLTDDPRVDARAVSTLLESFRSQFDRTWSPILELRPSDERASFFLFYSRHKYDQMLGSSAREVGAMSIGHYQGWTDIVALHTDTVPPGDLPDLLIHEATHQMVQMRILGLSAHAPPWVLEGLADYYGHMKRTRDGTFEEDRTGDKATALLHGGPATGTTPWRRSLATYQKEIRKGESLPTDLLIRIRDPLAFYAEGVGSRYAAAWNLVHYLMQDQGGRHRKPFARYLEAEARGEGSADLLYELLGINAEALEAALAEHVRRL